MEECLRILSGCYIKPGNGLERVEGLEKGTVSYYYPVICERRG